MDRRRLSSASLRVVLAVEDVLHAGVVALAGLLGRRDVTVLPFIGSGTPQRVHARGRVVLGPTVPSAAAELVRTAIAVDAVDAGNDVLPAVGPARAGDEPRAAGTVSAAGYANPAKPASAGNPAKPASAGNDAAAARPSAGAGTSDTGSAGPTGGGHDTGSASASAPAEPARVGRDAGAGGASGSAEPARVGHDEGAGGASARVEADGVVEADGGRRRAVGRRLVEVRGGVVRGRRAWGTLRASLAPFLTIELPRCVVWVGGPGGTVRGRCDRQGYLDVPVDVGGLAPGWHELSVTAAWRGAEAAVPVPVYVVDPGSRVAVISDLDDTVIETGITRGLEMLRLTLLTSVSDRTPLTGAAELYRALTAARGGPARPVFYLSTSPWNLYELLTRFLVLRGFPAGPLLLTDWGPSRTNLFRLSPEQHKVTMIRALLEQHPGLGVVLIGDTGEQDPEIYATVAQESPDRVRAVYVRRTAGMPAARAIEVSGLIRRVAAAGVPMLMVEDSVQIAEHAAGLGLLDPADVQAVRRATQL